MDYPIIRTKPDPRKYPRGATAQPGQTMMLCPIDRRMLPFQFEMGEQMRCTSCGFTIGIGQVT